MSVKERFLREEKGFSLIEAMVTMIIMIMMLFALYGLFDMGVRVFSFGNNEVEAMENARIGLEKIEREVRQAYEVDRGATPAQDHLFFSANGVATSNPPQAMPAANQITFGNEINDAGTSANKIDCPSPATCEYITYKLTDDASNAACTDSPCTLRRVNTANSGDAGDPLVENVVAFIDLDGDGIKDAGEAPGLTFTFYKSDGTAPANEGEIGKVLVSLGVTVNPGTDTEGTQELTTEIDLRNR